MPDCATAILRARSPTTGTARNVTASIIAAFGKTRPKRNTTLSAVKTHMTHESHTRIAATLIPTMMPQVSDSTVMLLPMGVRARFVTPKCTFNANSAAKASAAATSAHPKATARGPRSLAE